METRCGYERQAEKSVDVPQVEVPSIGSPEEDPKTVDLKLKQVQKEKGTMKVGCWLSLPCCASVAPVNILSQPCVHVGCCVMSAQQASLVPRAPKSLTGDCERVDNTERHHSKGLCWQQNILRPVAQQTRILWRVQRPREELSKGECCRWLLGGPSRWATLQS